MTDRKALAHMRSELVVFARSLTLDLGAAEDIVQEAIIRVLESPNAPDTTAALRPWAFRVVRNLFLDEQRKAAVRREYSALAARLNTEMPLAEIDPVEQIMVRQALESLPPMAREVLCLVDVFGLSYSEAAEVIDIPIGTVMSRVSRARKSLLKKLDDGNVRILKHRT